VFLQFVAIGEITVSTELPEKNDHSSIHAIHVLFHRTYFFRMLLGLPSPGGPIERKAFRSAVKVPLRDGEILVGAAVITSPILLAEPNIGLINDESFNIELERLEKKI
jgi:hypothetical protein